MHIISFRILREYAETHADCQEALSNWYKLATKAKWSTDFCKNTPALANRIRGYTDLC